MKITAKIQGENLVLVDALRKSGINAKLVKNGVIVELPKAECSSYQKTVFEAPKQLNGATLLIDCEEHGGGMTNTGSGTVVCGLSGKMLRPYFTPRRGHLACGAHGYFSVPGAVVTVTGYRRDTNVSIQEHRIKKDGELAWIETSDIWSGELEVLPNTYKRYEAAAEAAHRKANCYHCRCVHYGIVD